jgi:hypothetical protein
MCKFDPAAKPVILLDFLNPLFRQPLQYPSAVDIGGFAASIEDHDEVPKDAPGNPVTQQTDSDSGTAQA